MMIFILILHSVSLIPIYTVTLITLRCYCRFLVHNGTGCHFGKRHFGINSIRIAVKKYIYIFKFFKEI
jgi:hypothetical protein